MEHLSEGCHNIFLDAGLLVDEGVQYTAGIKQVADYHGRCHIVVHGVVAVLAQGVHILHLHPGLSLHLLSFLQALQGLPTVHQTCQTLLGALQGLVAEVHRTAVVGLQDEEADGHGRVSALQTLVLSGKELGQGDEVVVRLAHLLAVDGNHVVVHPIGHHGMSLACLCLCYLALVVGEDEVKAASVYVETLAQVLLAHCRALAVPAGETFAPGAWPVHDVLGACLLPQGKVGLVALLAHTCQGVAAGILDVLQRTAAQYAILVVLVVALYVEVDGTVALIGIAVVHNLLHQLLLLYDMTGGMRLDAGRQAVQCRHGLVEAVGIVLCHLHGLQLLQTCLLGNLVLTLVGIVLQVAHVGNVAHIAHLVALMLQVAEQQVESNGRASMSQVCIAIYRGSANVHAHTTLHQGTEQFLLAGQSIVNKKWLHSLFLYFGYKITNK